MKRVIFDIDGCISDDRWRLKMILAAGDDRWDEYHANCIHDKPLNKSVVDRHIAARDRIIFVTSRPDKYRNETWGWILRWFGEDADYVLHMRPDGDATPSPELKVWLLEKYGYEPEDIDVAYDDRQDVLDAYSEWGIKRTKQLSAATVPDILRNMAQTFDERQQMYGDSYLQFGKVAKALWPGGLDHQTEDDYNRLGVVVQIISKLCRYTNTAAGHLDSAHDIAVYAAILESLTDDSADL